MAAVTCPRCGLSFYPALGAQGCPRCGLPFGPVATSQPAPPPPYRPPPAPPRSGAPEPEALAGHAMGSLVLSVAGLGIVLFNVFALVAVALSLRAYFAVNRLQTPAAQELCPRARRWAVGSFWLSTTVAALTLMGWYLSG